MKRITKIESVKKISKKKLKVAAYARVSREILKGRIFRSD